MPEIVDHLLIPTDFWFSVLSICVDGKYDNFSIFLILTPFFPLDLLHVARTAK